MDPLRFDLPEPDWKTCPNCDGKYLASCSVCEEAARQVGARARRIAVGEQSIPPEYSEARLDNPSGLTPAGLAYADAYSATLVSLRRLVFLGPAGIGKTRLATALLRAWMAKTGQTALFVPAYKLGLARIQHRAGDGDALLVDQAMAAPLVLIDDLGQESRTATNAVPNVLQHRHEQRLPTWVTLGCGLTAEEAIERVTELYASDGIARRIFEGARPIQVHVPPPRAPAPTTAPRVEYDPAMRRAGGDS